MPLHLRSQILRNQRGAVDLPSIMVGAIVLGLLTAAILATVFTVIPWAQDNAAKQKVSQIVQAEAVYYTMSTDGSVGSASSTSDPQYGSIHDLASENLLSSVSGTGTNPTGSTQTSRDAQDKIKIVVTNVTASSTGNDAFAAYVRSDTGEVFYGTNQSPQPRNSSTPW